MYTFDLQRKLQALNPNLYVDVRGAGRMNENYTLVGIYSKVTKKRNSKYTSTQLNYGDKRAAKYLSDIYQGHMPTHVGGCDKSWVPEYDVFNFDKGEMLSQGWRTLLCSLAKRNFVNLSEARRVFRAGSLGEQTYDRLSLEKRIQFVKDRRGDRH